MKVKELIIALLDEDLNDEVVIHISNDTADYVGVDGIWGRSVGRTIYLEPDKELDFA